MRLPKIIAGFAIGASGCSLLASFDGLIGSEVCDGGSACDADGSSPRDAAATKMGDGPSIDAPGSDASVSDAGSDAPSTAITYVTSASKRSGVFQDAATAPIGSLTIDLPVAPAADDYMLAITYSDDYTTSSANTVTAPAPFAEDPTTGINPVPSSSHMAWFSARAPQGAGTSYTFVFGSSDNVAAAIIVYRGVSSTMPIETALAALCGDTTPLPAPYNYNPKPTKCATPSINTTRGHERIVFLYGLDSNSASAPPTWTPSNDVTKREDVGNILVADVADVAAGPPSIGSSQHSETGGYTAVKMIALEPQ